MQQNRIDLLYKILTIINYTKDKNEFIKEFEAMHYVEALVGILEKIPENLREGLRMKIEGGDKEEVLKYFSAEEYNNEVNKVGDATLKKFVEVISPILNLDQKQKISSIMSQ